ncbi:DUF2892 domain-containing protein [Oscillochloris sp. ZM17-4]|uniref:YgaP family membrane protein n=1 Tax=Oscillochloris sp. ZM17-4 TaxID=2866714 RepID=UPI001C72CAAE|nr:DUF2892 domain-containing protein [Oscillochloris sp. ZM17-4]MBX0329157.1 DUF2892 domain-containing protein [Oscillochloris sp. ZM17-4]
MEAWLNEGSIDRVVRLAVGVLLLGVAFIFLGGVWQIIVGLLGVIALATGAIGVCPLYRVFRINTK